MTVRAILDTKGHNILSVEPEAKLFSAVKLLGERKIGAVLVMTKGRIEGILSERDVVRVLSERDAAVLDEPVSAVMTQKVVSCKPSDGCSVHSTLRITVWSFPAIPHKTIPSAVF